jgi:hypothetical protein
MALGLLLYLLILPNSAFARDRSIRVPVTIHVAMHDGVSVVSEGRILDAVRRANRELAAYDVVLVVEAIDPMPGITRIDTPDDRFALAERAKPDGSVHVFYVDRLELPSLRRGDRRVSGMHWRYHGLDPGVRTREYLAVAHNAPSTTLVHEVGHAFGLAHDRNIDNLMCSCRRGNDPGFTPQQGRRLRNGARRFLVRQR